MEFPDCLEFWVYHLTMRYDGMESEYSYEEGDDDMITVIVMTMIMIS